MDAYSRNGDGLVCNIACNDLVVCRIVGSNELDAYATRNLMLRRPLRIPFGEWLPDQGTINNPGAITANNVVPGPKGYMPFISPTVVSGALGAQCQGAFSCSDNDGNTVTFAGTATKLYKFSNADSTWEDVSRLSGGAYATPVDGFWSFAKFGTRVIATNFIDDVQVFNLASDTDFSALAGSPPRAKFVCVAGEQVFLACLATDPQGVAWCGTDDCTTWASSQTTLADSQSLVGSDAGGFVTGLVGGDYVTVFKERSIFRGDFEGAPLIWRFREVVRNRGCTTSASIVPVNTSAFFLSDDGFYRWTGAGVENIGQNKVNKTFLDLLNSSYDYLVVGALDPANNLILWGFPVSQTYIDYIFVYNYALNRWSQISTVAYEWLFADLSKGYTLEQLDAISTSIDALPFSLDSREWTGGQLLLSAINTDHKLASFATYGFSDAASMIAATIDTSEIQVFPDSRALVQSIRPIVEGDFTGVTAQTKMSVLIAARDKTQFSTSSPSFVAGSGPQNLAVQTTNLWNFRSSGRYHRVRVTINAAAGWTHALGVELVDAIPDGYR